MPRISDRRVSVSKERAPRSPALYLWYVEAAGQPRSARCSTTDNCHAAAILKKVQESIHKALQVPHVRDFFLNNGYEPQGHTPAEWAKLFQADLKRYAEITRAAKIEPQ